MSFRVNKFKVKEKKPNNCFFFKLKNLICKSYFLNLVVTFAVGTSSES